MFLFSDKRTIVELIDQLNFKHLLLNCGINLRGARILPELKFDSNIEPIERCLHFVAKNRAVVIVVKNLFKRVTVARENNDSEQAHCEEDDQQRPEPQP